MQVLQTYLQNSSHYSRYRSEGMHVCGNASKLRRYLINLEHIIFKVLINQTIEYWNRF